MGLWTHSANNPQKYADTYRYGTCATKTPMTAVASSGAELPAAMKVAPAMSVSILSTATQAGS